MLSSTAFELYSLTRTSYADIINMSTYVLHIFGIYEYTEYVHAYHIPAVFSGVLFFADFA